MASRQKLVPFLINKVFSRWLKLKILLIKLVLLIWYLYKKIVFRKIKLIFDLENWLNIGNVQFLMAHHSLGLQNIKISFEYRILSIIRRSRIEDPLEKKTHQKVFLTTNYKTLLIIRPNSATVWDRDMYNTCLKSSEHFNMESGRYNPFWWPKLLWFELCFQNGIQNLKKFQIPKIIQNEYQNLKNFKTCIFGTYHALCLPFGCKYLIGTDIFLYIEHRRRYPKCEFWKFSESEIHFE
jgi:hypothetical protein